MRVADLRFTKAASMLSIAQSALSHQVRQLEKELDQTLLYRNGRGVMPTDAGGLMPKSEFVCFGPIADNRWRD